MLKPFLLAALILTRLAAAEPAVAARDAAWSELDRVVVGRFIGHAEVYAKALDPVKLREKCLENPEMFAWQEFVYLDCLLDAYEFTGEVRHLETFRTAFALVRELLTKGDDGFLGWYGKPIPPRRLKDRPDLQIDELQMNFRAIGILARWVALARQVPAYAQEHAPALAEFLALAEEQLYPKWDARGFYVDLGADGGVYRGLDYPLCNATAPGATLPHEKCSILVEALVRLHQATGKAAYLRRALALGARFKRILSLKDGHYEWMNWEPAGAWDVNPDKPDAWKQGWIAPDPNGGWYAAGVSIAMNLHQLGLLFDATDLQRFIATQKTRCWNGDLENPTYRTVAGVSAAESKFVKGRFLSYDLAVYDPLLDQLAFAGPHEAEVLASSQKSWQGGPMLAGYLRSKLIARPTLKAGQPLSAAAVGAAFLAEADNRAYYDRLAFTVVEPGRITPLKPSAMAP